MVDIKKYKIEDILPHDYPMLLLDEVVDYNKEDSFAVARVNISSDCIFFDSSLGGVSYLTGIEYMAQTVGVYAFFKNNMKPPKIGYLLGTRLFRSETDKFEDGKTYDIKAKEIFSDNNLVSFECLIYNENGEIIQQATVNCFIPEEEGSV